MRIRIAHAGVALVGLLALAGCVQAPVAMPTPEPVPSSSASSVPVGPELVLDGTAEQNLAYFDQVNEALISAGGTLDGRAFIDSLVAAGYPKADMEVTSDVTAINGAADNIEFSIRLGGTCLIGQYGNVGYASTTQALLATGHCLIGQTRPIDW